MIRTEFEISRTKHLANERTKRGLDLFEKYIGRIEWLHPEDEKHKVDENKRYRVINKTGEIVFTSDNITNIAKEYCLSVSHVSNCINSLTWLKGEYLVERCGDE
jgi:hypothetical protein